MPKNKLQVKNFIFFKKRLVLLFNVCYGFIQSKVKPMKKGGNYG